MQGLPIWLFLWPALMWPALMRPVLVRHTLQHWSHVNYFQRIICMAGCKKTLLNNPWSASLVYTGSMCCRTTLYRIFVWIFYCHQGEWQSLPREVCGDQCVLWCQLYWLFQRRWCIACKKHGGTNLWFLLITH